MEREQKIERLVQLDFRQARAGRGQGSAVPDIMQAIMDERIINRTRKQTLHERPRYATTAWQQAKGLMFRRPTTDDCIVFLFLPARPIRFHMWFVFGPIDILALDGQGTVIALKEDFRPWTLWNPGVTASAVVELPPGTIKKSGTSIGDVVALRWDVRHGR